MRSVFGLIAAGLCFALVCVSVLNDDISRKVNGGIEIAAGKAAARVQEIHRKVHGVDSTTSRTAANLKTKAGGGLRRVVYRVDENSRENSVEVAERNNSGKAGGKNPLPRETLEHWNRVLQENGSMSSTPTPSPTPVGTQTPMPSPTPVGTQPTVLKTPPPTVPPGVAPSPSIPSVYCKWFGTCSGGPSNWYQYSTRPHSGKGDKGSYGSWSKPSGSHNWSHRTSPTTSSWATRFSGGSSYSWSRKYKSYKSNADSQKTDSGNSGNNGYSSWHGRTNQGSTIGYHHKVASYFNRGGKRNLETTSKSVPTSNNTSRRHYPEKPQVLVKVNTDATAAEEKDSNNATNPTSSDNLKQPVVGEALDFFLAGFPQCGTTTLLDAVSKHKDTSISPKEHCAIHSPEIPDKAAYRELNKALAELNFNTSVKKGIECSTGIKSFNAIERLQRHSPGARIVIGVQHPVRFFQSFFNYRITQIYNKGLADVVPSVEDLVGSNEWKGISTDTARFEFYLMQLGKTKMSISDMGELARRPNMAVKPTPSKIFLYSLEQLEDIEKDRSTRFRREMQEFLQLQDPIDPFDQKKKNNLATEAEIINICDAKYKDVRALLVSQGKKTQQWIRNEFLKSSDVAVGNKNHFVELLDTWGHDPCQEVVNLSQKVMPRN